MAGLVEIRQRLSMWLDGEISRAQFEDWFVPATWDVHKSGDANLEKLVDEIELYLSEYSDGYLSKQQLRDAMVSILSKFSSHQVVVFATVSWGSVRSQTAGHLVSLPA